MGRAGGAAHLVLALVYAGAVYGFSMTEWSNRRLLAAGASLSASAGLATPSGPR